MAASIWLRKTCQSLWSIHRRSVLVPTDGCAKSLSSGSSVLATCIQKRDMSRRYSKPAPWLLKVEHAYYNEELTKENEAFLKEYVEDLYAKPTLPLGESPLKEPPWPRGEWEPRSRRTGVIAKKLGVYPMWRKDGKKFLSTLLQVVDNHVISYTPPEEYEKTLIGSRYKGRYGRIVVGAESIDPQLCTAEYNGLFKKSGVQTKRKLGRFPVTANAALQPGTPLCATHFRVGDVVDVWGKTIDHGFQGVVKRWGMKGGPASHGTTKAHRRVGTIGSGRSMSRVWPGKKMPGHMGAEWRSLKGAKIWRINTKYNVLYVTGPAIPGPNNAFVRVLDTVLPLRKPETPPPFPTYFPEDSKEPLAEDMYDKDCHIFSDPTIVFPEDKTTVKAKVKTGAKTAAKRQ